MNTHETLGLNIHEWTLVFSAGSFLFTVILMYVLLTAAFKVVDEASEGTLPERRKG
jgi:hypothetical protein